MANQKDTIVTQRLKSFFNIGYDREASKINDKIYALKNINKDIKDQRGNETSKVVAKIKEPFPSNVQKLFDFWQSDTHYSMQSWKSRNQMFQDCDLMFMNSTIMARAAEMVADETVQADSVSQIITIEAKRKVKQFIQKLFDDINIYEHIRPTALSIAKYGNAGWILDFDNNGVCGIIPRSVYGIKERLEFSPYEVQELMRNKNKFLYDYKSRITRIDQLIDMITNKDNIASYYKDYLFGFVIDDYALPPWRFLHFRNSYAESPFKPFGVPLYIHSIAAYMQFDAAMTMQICARGAAFPKEVYSINLPSAMPPTEKLNTAIEFMKELQNSGINATAKERDGVGEKIITVKDLYEYELQNPQMDLGKMGDIEALRDDLIISTMLPRNLLDPNESGFGDSGLAVIQKSKPFARLIYRMQSIILQNITQLVKIHMIHSRKFSLDEMDFSLSMPYPESQASEELVRSQNDLLSLSNNVIDALSQKFMGGDNLPPEVIRNIYTKFLPYEDATVDSWIKGIMKNKDRQEEPEQEEEPVMRGDKERIQEWKIIEKKFGGKIKLKEAIDNAIFDYKQSILREGVIRNNHYYSSKNQYLEFPAETLRKLDIKESNKVITGKEEIKFKKKYKLK